MNLYVWAFPRAAAVLLLLFVLNSLGVFFHLYGVLWWWDVMNHFLGGMVIWLLLIGIFSRIGVKRLRKCALIAAAVVFVGWEVYEVVVSTLVLPHPIDWIDTVHDLFNDSIGSVCAYFWTSQFYAEREG